MFARSAFVFLSFLVLAGCGFQPVYDGATRFKLAQIHVLPIAERQGQVLKTALRDRLNPNGIEIAAAYDLDLRVTTSMAASFADQQGAYRARGTYQATGRLVSHAGTVIWQGQARAAALTAQDELPSISQRIADQLWEDLAQQVADDLTLQFANALR